jgi:hypothetical protein
VAAGLRVARARSLARFSRTGGVADMNYYYAAMAVIALLHAVAVLCGYEPSHRTVAAIAFCSFAMACSIRIKHDS